ncbi:MULTISPECIES: DNA polymerase III subunit delta' [Alteribacter]|uniref:DNA polymerase III subunit delta' n=1 Tax=Alteribacter keqinensis TaxID=2483800 RepID=A0A3M7TKY2_9BACI|nr:MULTISPECIES: DNA polymerase III subunit delta' [Alteribacter]MBM7098034.1 DNA polymerase III subunit delta' [Alteribacter salitolerans]RNA66066.1 DNA polymerase III subunit delta' [Alteribacter keqinensis]
MNWEQLASTQPTVVKMINNSLKKNRLAHAYLFEGGRGTGKRQVAQQLARSFFCSDVNDGEPCGRCSDCRRIKSGNHPDVHLIKTDGQTIKVDQIRHLKKEFSYRGMESAKKVYLVEDAEKMTPNAANSILKFLEEPDGEALAVLMTTQYHRILKTIVSRSQVLSFAPLPPDKLVKEMIKEGISKAQAQVAAQLTSDLEEAKGLCEENWIAQARTKVIQLTDEVSKRPRYAYLMLQDGWMGFFKEKSEMQTGLDLLMIWYRDVIRMQLDQQNELVFFDQEERLKDEALKVSQMKLGNNLTAILEAKRRLDANTSPQLVMEQLLLRLQEG